jgi:hypothetical protein
MPTGQWIIPLHLHLHSTDMQVEADTANPAVRHQQSGQNSNPDESRSTPGAQQQQQGQREVIDLVEEETEAMEVDGAEQALEQNGAGQVDGDGTGDGVMPTRR